jgi:uncharacterized protein
MDDILASIRKIISEDDAPAGAAPAVGEAPAADAHIMELADRLPGTAADEASVSAAEPAAHDPPPKPAPPGAHEALLGDASASATASSFETLKTAADDAAQARSTMTLPPPGRTLEEVTRELLRPLLKAWLDEHLPAIVQDRVDEEVARIARGRVR